MAKASDGPNLPVDGLADTAAGPSVGRDTASWSPAQPNGDVERPPTVGRYSIESELGRGGMAVVYVAHDPELKRKVALKLILGRSHEPRARARLLREAQALAQLKHPNVVTVHDAGVAGEQVFLAMELVEGRSLRDWLDETVRPWPEVLALFVAAGRGLAAAHAAGLVHRDFKPENVLVGDDGSVRVADFGLARLAGDSSEDHGEPAPAGTPAPLTQTGDVLGTPNYMAPEQHTGDATDARSDQFSFAVALYQGLYGQRPFVAASLPELRQAVLTGALCAPPRKSNVPRRLERALRRALAVDPAARWPSMTALLAELTQDRARRWKRRLWAAAALLAVGISVAVGTTLATVDRKRTAACSGIDQRLSTVWNQGVRQRIRNAFLGSGRAHAAATAARVDELLDRHSAAWRAMRQDACQATYVRHEQSEALFDLRVECLNRKLGELHALTEVFSAATPDVVDHSVEAVSSLTPLDGCGERSALGATVAPPRDPALAARLARTETQLDRAHASWSAGQFKEAVTLAGAALPEARALGYSPILAQALFVLGYSQESAGDFAAAEATAYQAARAAAEAHDDTLAARTQRLILSLLSEQGRLDQALALEPLAQAAVARAGGDDLLTAELLEEESYLYERQRKFALSVDASSRALALFEKRKGPRSLDVARILGNSGSAVRRLGQLDQARARYERALSIATAELGLEHPTVAMLAGSLGQVLFEQGHYAEARVQLERALAIKEKTFGPQHLSVATTRMSLALVAMSQGRLDDARLGLQSVVALRERLLPADHPQLANALQNLGAVLGYAGDSAGGAALIERALRLYDAKFGAAAAERDDVATALGYLAAIKDDLGRSAEARALLARALSIRTRAFGPDHWLVGATRVQLADVLYHEAKYREAEPLYREGLAIEEKALASEHPELVRALLGLGASWARAGRISEALPLFERGLTICDAGSLPRLVALLRVQTARALWPTGDRRRARALIVPALEVLHRQVVATGGGAATVNHEYEEARRWWASVSRERRAGPAPP